jgi:hypothetical protein
MAKLRIAILEVEGEPAVIEQAVEAFQQSITAGALVPPGEAEPMEYGYDRELPTIEEVPREELTLDCPRVRQAVAETLREESERYEPSSEPQQAIQPDPAPSPKRKGSAPVGWGKHRGARLEAILATLHDGPLTSLAIYERLELSDPADRARAAGWIHEARERELIEGQSPGPLTLTPKGRERLGLPAVKPEPEPVPAPPAAPKPVLTGISKRIVEALHDGPRTLAQLWTAQGLLDVPSETVTQSVEALVKRGLVVEKSGRYEAVHHA